MLAYALGLLAFLRSTQGYGATRRALSVVFCITWMEACARVWPAHVNLLRGAAMLAAEGDLMGSQLDGAWSLLVPYVGYVAALLVPSLLAVVTPHMTFNSTVPYMSTLVMASIGYVSALVADSQCVVAASACVESIGLVALSVLLGID